MQLDAQKAADMYKRSEVDSASLIEAKIAVAAVGNGVMPRRYLFTSCNAPAAKELRGAGFRVNRFGPYALVRW